MPLVFFQIEVEVHLATLETLDMTVFLSVDLASGCLFSAEMGICEAPGGGVVSTATFSSIGSQHILA